MSRRLPSLTARLTRMNLMVSGLALLMATLAFSFYDTVSFRNNLIHSLDAEAQIVGENTVSALMFNDRQTAANTLNGLQRAPDVLGGVLAARDGSVFARYGVLDQRELLSHTLGSAQGDQVWRSGRHVLVAHRIVFQGESLGVVYISARLTEVPRRVRQYLLIALIILLLSMAAAVLIGSLAQRLIAQPIVALAETALQVSRDEDYSVRADVSADIREISVLIQAFNAMLVQIQERDAALREARTQLEVRVEQRTEELRAANRELEAFSYTVAHDLRGPLDALAGIVFLLGQSTRYGGDPKAGEMVEQIKDSTAHMGSIIDDLLNFARASAAPTASTSVDLSAIARQIAGELTAAAPERKVEFIIEQTPAVRADPGLMRIVLDNLLGNAWKYTSRHDHARIEFRAARIFGPDDRTERLIYFVRDDGAGFDHRRMDKLFMPFQRLHGKQEFPGTGIGLATVRRILARQGGSIWAEGDVEKGATFFFAFP